MQQDIDEHDDCLHDGDQGNPMRFALGSRTFEEASHLRVVADRSSGVHAEKGADARERP